MTTLGPTKISGEGLVYPFEGGAVRVEVLVSLDDDGFGWRVRFDVGGSQYSGHGQGPVAAFRIAAELAREQTAARGTLLDIDGIEAALKGAHALDTERRIALTLSPLHALGIPNAYPRAVEPQVVERSFREADFMARTEGVRSPHWQVRETGWKDFGRELVVIVCLGRSHQDESATT